MPRLCETPPVFAALAVSLSTTVLFVACGTSAEGDASGTSDASGGRAGTGGTGGANAGAGGATAGKGGAKAGGAAGVGGQAGSSGGASGTSATSGASGSAGKGGQAGGAGFPGSAGGASGSAAALPTGRFRIGMWCGPPASELTAARFAEIADVGITTMSNACDGSTYVPSYNLQALSLAEAHGLDVIVADQRLQAALAGTDVAKNLDAVVADYAAQPALAGYFLGDEPSAGAFANLGSTVAALTMRDSAHFSYTNLLPDYASAAQLGTATYDDYVAQFLGTVKPQVFSYDYYPFLSGGGEQATFFADMAVIRAHAVATGVPFWQFTQSISFNGHRATNLAEKQWVGMETLAYGGAGISYFTYWTPPQTSEGFGDGIIDAAGKPSSQYQDVKAINARLSAFGRYLVAAKSTTVFQNGPLSAGMVPRVPQAMVYVPSAAPITVGEFSVGSDAYAFLVNRSYSAATASDVYLAPTTAAPEVLDVPSGKFVPLTPLAKDGNGLRIHVDLAPGDATLVHLVGPIPAGAPGAEAYVGVVRSDAGTLDVVDSSFGALTVRPAGWKDCPTGYTLIGTQLESNGFWLCARGDLADRAFLMGNVVKDAGALYAVHAGVVTPQGTGGWDECPGATELGKRFESNGYWLCLMP